MMDISNYNLVVILTMGVVGVFTYVVYRNIMMVPTELKNKLVELREIFKIQNDNSFHTLEPEEQQKILDDFITTLQQLNSNKANLLINKLQEKKKMLAEAQEGITKLTTFLDDQNDENSGEYLRLRQRLGRIFDDLMPSLDESADSSDEFADSSDESIPSPDEFMTSQPAAATQEVNVQESQLEQAILRARENMQEEIDGQAI